MEREKREYGTIVDDKYLFFWKGPFSQWYKAPMVGSENIHYNCCEQYMMYNKAILFRDYDTADKILRTKNPREQKALGRAVKNFETAIWDREKESIVEQGNYIKFSQNYSLRKMLLKTSELTIAEASPVDSIWGIGIAEDASDVTDETKWGQNLLGKALMKVRKQLLEKPVSCRWRDAKDDFSLEFADDLLFAHKCNMTLTKKEEEELALQISKDMKITDFSINCLYS